jgi:hypothetical protein
MFINNERTLIVNKMKNHTKIDILGDAIKAAQAQIGIELHIKRRDYKIENRHIDAIIEVPGVEEPLMVEVKKWAQQANFGALINQVLNLPGKGMLVADYINPNMADKLRRENIQFLDLAGNVHINMPPVYVFVKGNKPKNKIIKINTATGIAFGVAGLRVVFLLLCNNEYVNKPYRNIAEKAGVALGTVAKIFEDLKAMGFVVERAGTKNRRLGNKHKLFERWVENYPDKLRVKLYLGEFIAEKNEWWKTFQVQGVNGLWGGEVAAALKTDYLKPQDVTVYIPEDEKHKLLQKAKLRKAHQFDIATGNTVKVYKKFWLLDEDVRTVPDILIYADLIATADPRNIEVANKIYTDYIDEFI